MYCAIRSWNHDVEKNTIVTSDAIGYELLAENILHYHNFAGTYDTAGIPINSIQLTAGHLIVDYDTFRAPGYPTFLAIIYFIVGIKPFVAIFIQLLLNVISLILIYRITLLLFNNNVVNTIAGLLFAIDIHSIYVANVLYSDTLFIFLFLLSIYYFIIGLQNKNIFKFILSAIFIGLACLTRPVSLLYPLVFIVVLLLFYRNSWRFVMKVSALYMLVTYCIVGIWAYRNHNTYGRWQLTTEDRYGLLMFDVAFSESRHSLIPIEPVRMNLEKQCDSMGCLKFKNPFDRSNICGKVAWAHIKADKVDYLETLVWGAIHMFLSIGNIDMAQTLGWSTSNVEGQLIMDSQRLKQNFLYKGQAILAILVIIVLIIQYFGAVLGLFFLVKNKKYFIITFSVLSIFYFSAVTGAVGKYRYKLPMQFVICSMAGYGYYTIFKRKAKA